MQKKEILVVDDERNIRDTLEGILLDEGYNVQKAETGREAMRKLKEHLPDLVLLDIWLPEIDGLEVLQKTLKKNPETRIVMMSGHASIDTAVKATRIGAKAFIEKPISMDEFLETVHAVLDEEVAKEEKPTPQAEKKPFSRKRKPPAPHTATPFCQRSITRSIALTGLGLHSGAKTGVILHPAPPDTGILFEDINSGERIKATVENVDTTGYATSLSRGAMSVKTVEHLLSALHMHRIGNLVVTVCDEVPIFDGSAQEFCTLFDDGCIKEQPQEDALEIIIDKTYRVHKDGNPDCWIQIEPAEEFSVEYLLDYPEPAGKQQYTFTGLNEKKYAEEIAPARTFGFLHELSYLQKQGLGGGGKLDNVIIVDAEKKYISQELRFPEEFARHKILDVIGDVYLLGCFLRGKITAHKTGHTENIELVRLLKKELFQ